MAPDQFGSILKPPEKFKMSNEKDNTRDFKNLRDTNININRRRNESEIIKGTLKKDNSCLESDIKNKNNLFSDKDKNKNKRSRSQSPNCRWDDPVKLFSEVTIYLFNELIN